VGVDVRDRWFCLLWPAVKQAQFAIVAAAGPMLEDAGAASALYDEVLADTELGRPEFAAWRLTFLYRLAESAARRGNPARAVDLLKGVVEIPYADDIPLMRLADVATPADSSQGVQTAARALLGRIRDTAAAEQGREDSAQEGGGSLP